MWVIAIACLRRTLYLALVALLLSFWPAPGAAAAMTVDKVTVTISAPEPPPASVAKRMATSITRVGEEMLGGRTISDIKLNQTVFEKLVREIFDRVLVGYTVETVSITPGATTHIGVTIVPWGELVRNVTLEFDMAGLSTEVAGLVKQDLGNIEDQVANVLIGLPVDSVDWAGGVSRVVIRQLLQDQLPEFRSNLEITAGRVTHIRLSLIPTGPVIDNIRLSLKSHTIPNILLAEAENPIREEASMLRGLPVSFVERHQDYFTGRIAEAAVRQPIVGRYSLTIAPAVHAGTDTEIIINAETAKYRVTLEGSLDMGRHEDNTMAKLHIGKFISRRDEVFFETRFFPEDLSWRFEPGWGHKFNDNAIVGIRYNISDKESTLWANQHLGSSWTIRFEHQTKSADNEFGIKYKLHDSLSAEYVIANKDSWLRLIANL